MNVIETPLKDLYIIEPKVLGDDRGYFFESFNAGQLKMHTGFDIAFIQDNQARSSKNVLRGLHYQNAPTPQTKLVRALEGTIWDVVVDIRKESPTFGQWFGVELSAENKRQLLVPRGFAHGYSVLTDTAEVFYKCDNFYDKSTEGGIYFNDASLSIDWKMNVNDALLSEKDKAQPLFKDAVYNF
ncbi:MAG: dTDP-4-dehydrorhamnose 3,5-epimerase [Sphingobacteriales bacterium]|nr:MAG: dTDP-4-dehydrorhamnose 3,5-epimerase [Sphingobacteriales bacterium]